MINVHLGCIGADWYEQICLYGKFDLKWAKILANTLILLINSRENAQNNLLVNPVLMPPRSEIFEGIQSLPNLVILHMIRHGTSKFRLNIGT